MTMACVMAVQLTSTPESPLQILKLYDRRFAAQLRENEGIEPWDPEREHYYEELIQTGKRDELFEAWTAGFAGTPFHEAQAEDWHDIGTQEAYQHFLIERKYDAEKHAYELMHDLQGIDVPRFEGDVTASVPGIIEDPEVGPVDRTFNCSGILLQYIHGFELTDLDKELPSEQWQGVFDDALRILHEAAERGISNPDMGLRSFFVRPDPDGSKPLVYMLDFGECVFRDRMLHGEQFRSFQACEDEEGALAYLGFLLKRDHGFELEYTRSQRAIGLDNDFMREDCEPGIYLHCKYRHARLEKEAAERAARKKLAGAASKTENGSTVG